MPLQIGLITLVVGDYDDAIAFYTQKLGFALITDDVMSPAKRWVVVAPEPGASGLLLAKAADAQEQEAIERQAGGRVFLFLHTDDFDRDYAAFRARGVSFSEEPRSEPYGRVAVFEDLYGNTWDLIQHTQ